MTASADLRDGPPASETASTPGRRRPSARTFLLEVLLLAGLLGAYQLGRHLASAELSTALNNAVRVWDLERAVRLPSELALQRVVLHWSPLVRLVNLYYVGVHFPATTVALLWLFFRHRPLYLRVRTEMAVLTGAALVVHIAFPLAPPRLVTSFGMVDTMLAVGPSAYPRGGEEGFANQYAAMPSLHVGWAVLLAIAVIRVGRSRWRWLAVLHPVTTLLVVVVSANHYWLDGLVAVLLLIGSVALVRRFGRLTGNGSGRASGPAGGHDRTGPPADGGRGDVAAVPGPRIPAARIPTARPAAGRIPTARPPAGRVPPARSPLDDQLMGLAPAATEAPAGPAVPALGLDPATRLNATMMEQPAVRTGPAPDSRRPLTPQL